MIIKAKIEYSLRQDPYTREEWYDNAPRVALYDRVFDIMGMVGFEKVTVTAIEHINGASHD